MAGGEESHPEADLLVTSTHFFFFLFFLLLFEIHPLPSLFFDNVGPNPGLPFLPQRDAQL